MVESPPSAVPPPLDAMGALLTCGGLGTATYMAYLLSQRTVAWEEAGAFAVASVVLLAVAVGHLRHATHPLINLRTLRAPTLRVSVGAGSLFWMAVTAVPFLLTLLFQDTFGWSPVKSGALVMFVFVGNLAIKPVTTPLLRRFGFRRILCAATALASATMVVFASVRSTTPLAVIALVAILDGAGRSTGLTCYSTIAFADTRETELRDANTLQATAQQLSIGLAAPAAAIALRAGGPLGRLLPGADGLRAPYSVGFLLLAVVTLVATAAAARMGTEAGSAVTRAPREETTTS
jgi:hypothetical protein